MEEGGVDSARVRVVEKKWKVLWLWKREERRWKNRRWFNSEFNLEVLRIENVRDMMVKKGIFIEGIGV